jgi:hypothetical protein
VSRLRVCSWRGSENAHLFVPQVIARRRSPADRVTTLSAESRPRQPPCAPTRAHGSAPEGPSAASACRSASRSGGERARILAPDGLRLRRSARPQDRAPSARPADRAGDPGCNLPDTSGFDLCREIRKRRPELPVLLISASYRAEEQHAECRAADRCSGAARAGRAADVGVSGVVESRGTRFASSASRVADSDARAAGSPMLHGGG